MKKILFLLIIPLIIFGFWLANEAKASASDNVSGWAWSENIGWISFNNTTGGGATNYGVHICTGDTDSLCTAIAAPKTGKFVGYAWSENIGWISFNQSDLVGCPISPCQAQLDLSTNRISGWAKALADGGGWDGWLRLRDTNYGIWLDTDVSPYEFRDWAWSDMVIGWLSFNCADRGICGTSNYKVLFTSLVVNQAPLVNNLQAIQPDYCSLAPAIFFSWDYSDPDGNAQSAYQFQVERTSSPAGVLVDCPEVTQTINSGQKGTSAIKVVGSPTPALCDLPSYVGDINYGSDFQARVRVKDSAGSWSTNWSDWVSFSTPDHAYPAPDFTPSPQNPAIAEVVTFLDNSTCYLTGGGEDFCKNLANIRYQWDFQDDGIVDCDSNIKPTCQGNATTTYATTGTKTVRLTITDNSLTPAGICDTTRPVNTSLPLPDWKEITPF